MDLMLDEETHDIVFINGVSPVVSEARQDLAQRLKIRLLTFKGEYFLNLDTGVPYYQSVVGKQRSKAAVDAIFQEQILSEPDALEITQFESSINSATRQYSLTFRVRTDSGTTDPITI